MDRIELFNDHFQNFKVYQIPKAQLIIADPPYNLGVNAYASNPAWYVDGDNKNGESELAGKEFFDTDKNFKPAEFMHFCSQMLVKEPKTGVTDQDIENDANSKAGSRQKSKAPCMVLFCAFEQLQYYIELGRRYGFMHYIPLVFLLTGAFAYAVIYPAVNAGKTVTVLLTVYMFFPALAAVVTRLITREGFRDHMLHFRFKGHVKHYLLAWLGPGVLTILGAIFPTDIIPEYTSTFRSLEPEMPVLRAENAAPDSASVIHRLHALNMEDALPMCIAYLHVLLARHPQSDPGSGGGMGLAGVHVPPAHGKAGPGPGTAAGGRDLGTLARAHHPPGP